MAAIEVRGLSKDYGEVLANDDLTFSVEAGEVFGYLGPNGAGKTTTIRTLMGFLSPTAGSATVLGHDVTDESELVAAKRRIGYLPANPAFDEDATGREVLDLHASIKGDERRAELLDVFDPPIDRRIRTYSTGNVQKLGLVQAFMHDPDLVVMDEPTAGLDPLVQREFNEFLAAQTDRGLTAFLSSHVLSEVRRVCDRVGVLREGRLVATERVEDLLDRTGKVVRVRVAGAVDPRAFAVDGAHDVSCSTTDGSDERPADGAAERADGADVSAGGADERTDAGPAEEGSPTAGAPSGPDASPATDAAVTGDDAGATNGGTAGASADAGVHGSVTECTFTFTGDVNDLLAVLSAHTLLDLDVEEAPLEEVFMRFYGGEDDA